MLNEPKKNINIAKSTIEKYLNIYNMNPNSTLRFILLLAIVYTVSCKKNNDSNDWNKDLKFQVDTVINITETTALIQ